MLAVPRCGRMAPEAFVLEHAPEHVPEGEEDRHTYDARVDVWSLGITAIELLEGLPPHAENKSIFQVMLRIANGPPPTLQPSTAASDAYAAFVARALVKEPAERPTARALLAADPLIAGATAAGLVAVLAEGGTSGGVAAGATVGASGTLVLSQS